MTERKSAKRWATDIRAILKSSGLGDDFPVNIEVTAKDISKNICSEEPITHIEGGNLENFEGALVKKPNHDGWGIIYNNSIKSKGRQRFTIAHEFGHYLLHRTDYPDGLHCDSVDMRTFDHGYKKIEAEANEFAANLLMPVDDFRKLILVNSLPTIKQLSDCSKRYGTSLTATTNQWLKFTESKSMLVASRDGFMLWANSSDAAFKSRLYFKTTTETIPIPADSLANDISDEAKEYIDHPQGVWRNASCREYVFKTEYYDQTLSLLHFQDSNESNSADEIKEFED